MAIVRFFKMAAAVIMILKKKLQFLTIGHARTVELIHCAKFRLNRSNCVGIAPTAAEIW